jgi:hypothetical protein
MRSKTILLAAVVVALSLAQPARARRDSPRQSAPQRPASGAEKWERYTYEGEEFSVELPGMPSVFRTSRSVGVMESEPMRTFGLYSDGVVYVVTSFDNPRPGETLDYLAAYPAAGGGRKATRALKLGGFGGAEYEDSGVVNSRTRVFRARRHAYRVTAMARGGDDPRFARFLDSFALGGAPKGVGIYDRSPRQAAASLPPQPAAPPSTHAEGEPYKSSEVARKALIVYKPEPSFTEEARRNSVTGAVRLRAVLAADGRATRITVVKGLPDGLTETDVYAALHILFFPAEADGHIVSQYVTLEYNFNIY